MTDSSPEQQSLPKIDTTRPHSARVWNYWIGGKDNYPIDRQVGDQIAQMFPGILEVARHARAFLGRAVRFMAGEAGIRQFLDIGTGLPTHGNTHEIAQSVAPECRIVYVDNDPLVLVHARALLVSDPRGMTAYIDADVRDTDKILNEAAATLDFTRPIGLMMLGIMGNIWDDDEAYAITRRLVDALPSGSYMALEDGVFDVVDPEAAKETERYRAEAGDPYRLRDHERITRFFDGLEILEPGVVPVSQWRPEALPFGTPPPVSALAGVGRKP